MYMIFISDFEAYESGGVMLQLCITMKQTVRAISIIYI